MYIMNSTNNTAESFFSKWKNNPDLAFSETLREGSDIRNWILNRNGFQSATELSSGLRMAIAKKCIDCHQYQSNQIAPTWNDIYVRQKDAFEPHPAMVKAILHGSVNRYGAMEMMPQSEIVSEAEAAVLATWILNGAH